MDTQDLDTHGFDDQDEGDEKHQVKRRVETKLSELVRMIKVFAIRIQDMPIQTEVPKPVKSSKRHKGKAKDTVVAS